jgi:indolepyruvate decarboxylase
MQDQYTVAHYMKDRLEELGLDRMFGVAGNYTAALLDTILAEDQPAISISGCANELTAGYAADAYARYKGIGAVFVTYSVGAFIALNPISGSFVEKAPVVLINGAPTNKEDSVEKNAGLLYSHTTGYQFVDIHMFRPVTAAAERITNGKQAPFQIDSALTALLTEKRPVYFEVTEDVWRVPCPRPEGKLKAGTHAIITNSEQDLQKAVDETMKVITKDVSFLTKDRSKKREVIFWAGVEIQRYGLQDKFLKLLQVVNRLAGVTGYPIGFVTSPLSKSVISEDHEYFKGCVTMTSQKIEELVGETGCVVGIGAWTIGKDVHNQNIRSDATILASHGGVMAGAKYIPMVQLEDYIDKLTQAFVELAEEELQALKALELERPKIHALNLRSAKALPMTYNLFFKDFENFVSDEHIVVADAGFPLIGAQSVHIPSQNGFVGQAAWLSIGYSVGAATGIKCANPDKRVLVVVGDGAFHETCQAMSDHMTNGHNTVVFLMNNGTYGIEQFIVNPNPYRETPVQYPIKPKSSNLQNHIYPYNKLPSWNFVAFAETFGATGIKVENTADMQKAMSTIAAHPDGRFLVEVCLPADDSPGQLSVSAMDEVGEDEIGNPNWPPAGKF